MRTGSARHLTSLLTLAFLASACDDAPATPPPIADASNDLAVDAALPSDAPLADVPEPSDVVSCASRCEALAGPCQVNATQCAAACTTGALPGDGGQSMPVAQCLAAADGRCSAARACLRPAPSTAFSMGPYGANVLDLAAPFTVTTSDGDWSFQEEWTGEDSYLFLSYAPGALVYRNGVDYSRTLFEGPLTELLARSPRNVHYFFLNNTSMAEAFDGQRDAWLGELETLPEEERAHWRPRLHFVSARATTLNNWIGRMLAARARSMLPNKRYDAIQFGIDRSQRIREVGQLGRLVTNGLQTELPALANEARYYNWERTRDQRLAREAPTTRIIELARARTAHDTIDVDVELPDAATLAMYDTMEVDLAMECPNHRDGECGAWDYLSYLHVCSPGPVGDGGVASWVCDQEIARWITTYWREARWVTDISGMLPQLRRGGRTHFRWNASGQFDPRRTDYIVTLSLRLSNRARPMRPVETVPLWTGGSWNEMYDANHTPRRVTIPADVRRVELYALITGHGGVQPTNCAEFCNHVHNFGINGTVNTRAFPEARAASACADRTGEGVVPNQHGTWYFGRGGWCPGLDVAPWIVDVTSQVRLGAENEITYRTLFNGRPVTAGLGNIVLSTYLVYWR